MPLSSTAYLSQVAKLERARFRVHHACTGAAAGSLLHLQVRQQRSRLTRIAQGVYFLRRAPTQVVEHSLAVVDLDLRVGEDLGMVAHLVLDHGFMFHATGDVSADHCHRERQRGDGVTAWVDGSRGPVSSTSTSIHPPRNTHYTQRFGLCFIKSTAQHNASF